MPLPPLQNQEGFDAISTKAEAGAPIQDNFHPLILLWQSLMPGHYAISFPSGLVFMCLINYLIIIKVFWGGVLKSQCELFFIGEFSYKGILYEQGHIFAYQMIPLEAPLSEWSRALVCFC